jgi:hypothetical protein
MGTKARNYSPQTLKKLFGLSGNQCSFPGCPKQLVNENNAKDSNICHIEGANDEGERYREDMTDTERAGYNNLILLCVQHHDETNDVSKYDVASLQKMKQTHIAKNTGEKIRNNPSMLKNTVNAIAAIDIDEYENENDLTAFNITEKLNYNNIIKNAPLIQEYKVYHHKINSLYDELEAQGSLKKNKILALIRNYYIKAKGAYSSSSEISIETVRLHADEIIDDVLKSLCSELYGSDEFVDDIIIGVDLIVVDAFMRCKILEKPQ